MCSTWFGINRKLQVQVAYNYYALLTITMLIVLTLFKIDYGPMKKHEENALAEDLFTTENRLYDDEVKEGDKKAAWSI